MTPFGIDAQDWDNYQYRQLRHDVRFHADICSLRMGSRIAHVVLHLSKYVGALFSSDERSPDYQRALVDLLIMCGSACTALNIHIGSLTPSIGASSDPFPVRAAVLVGKLAKATESTDHVEDYSSRAEWNHLFPMLFFFAVSHCQAIGIDPLASVMSRLEAVESKNPLRHLLERM